MSIVYHHFGKSETQFMKIISEKLKLRLDFGKTEMYTWDEMNGGDQDEYE